MMDGLDNRGQADLALLLAAGIAIVAATIGGLVLKALFTSQQPTIQGQTGNVVNSLTTTI
jgi:uncharacterized protein (UPF0333 family)